MSFSDEKEVDIPCLQCKHRPVLVKTWDSDDGAYTDYKYTCPNCKHYWWVDGPDA